MSDSTGSSGGISVFGLLGVVFVTLKLCGVIDWSWWWVTLPFWGCGAIAGGALIALGVVTVVVLLFERYAERRKRKERT